MSKSQNCLLGCAAGMCARLWDYPVFFFVVAMSKSLDASLYQSCSLQFDFSNLVGSFVPRNRVTAEDGRDTCSSSECTETIPCNGGQKPYRYEYVFSRSLKEPCCHVGDWVAAEVEDTLFVHSFSGCISNCT